MAYGVCVEADIPTEDVPSTIPPDRGMAATPPWATERGSDAQAGGPIDQASVPYRAAILTWGMPPRCRSRALAMVSNATSGHLA
jgi:hypothetical protein